MQNSQPIFKHSYSILYHEQHSGLETVSEQVAMYTSNCMILSLMKSNRDNRPQLILTKPIPDSPINDCINILGGQQKHF